MSEHLSHLLLAVLDILARSAEPLTAEACGRQFNPSGVTHPSRVLGGARRHGLAELVSGEPNRYRITAAGRAVLSANAPPAPGAPMPEWLASLLRRGLTRFERQPLAEEPERDAWLAGLKPGAEVLVLWGPPAQAEEDEYEWSMVADITDGVILLSPVGPRVQVASGARLEKARESGSMEATIFPPVGERARAARARYLRSFIQNATPRAWKNVPTPVLELLGWMLGASR